MIRKYSYGVVEVLFVDCECVHREQDFGVRQWIGADATDGVAGMGAV